MRLPIAFLTGSALLLGLSACSANTEEQSKDGTDVPAATASAPAPALGAQSQTAIINPNTATTEQLQAVPGVSPQIASAILAGRPYADAEAFDDALEKSVADDKARKALLTRVFVPVNLNTASEDAIETIPGMTDKMVHEFLEYRPYTDMAEFDREIGKYVDAAEVARLRRYVTL